MSWNHCISKLACYPSTAVPSVAKEARLKDLRHRNFFCKGPLCLWAMLEAKHYFPVTSTHWTMLALLHMITVAGAVTLCLVGCAHTCLHKWNLGLAPDRGCGYWAMLLQVLYWFQAGSSSTSSLRAPSDTCLCDDCKVELFLILHIFWV